MEETFDTHRCFVNLTYSCNNHCVSCIMENHHQKENGPSFEHVLEEIDRISKFSDHIEFNGGEPTLNPHLFRILGYANKKNIEVGLISNVRVFSYKKCLNQLLRLRLNNFKIITTIYGHSALLHDSITRAPGSFEQQIMGIRNLILAGIKVELRVVINKLNYKFLLEISNHLTNNFSCDNFIRVDFINTKLTGQALRNSNVVSVRTTKIVPFLVEAATKLKQHKFDVKLFHFPHCVLPEGLWSDSVGLSAEKSEVRFLDKCNACSKKKVCSGIWKSYLDLFKDGEFEGISE